MCGFAGFVTLDDVDPRRFEVVLSRMSNLLRHRGPDASGTYYDDSCGLTHQRLSIIDLTEAGQQPMSNEDGTVWIVYNGEIYNFRELRKQFALDRLGHHFRSRTDTEVLVHLYEELGIDFVKKLNGMFAFALRDKRAHLLHLARDPFGIKPLFYTQTKEALWFASEIKALLHVPNFTPRPSLEALHHYLSFNIVPGTLTAFENIFELPPGHVLSVDSARRTRTERRFFDLYYETNEGISEKEAVQRSRECLKEAVRRQLVADVPVGVMLSGGMDSSALTALMAEVRGDPDFHTFSIGFDDKSFDESRYAEVVARRAGTSHHAIHVTPEKVTELLPRYLSYIDEPYADGSAIPTYLLAEVAKDYVTVLLSGEGGDEFYSGYETHAAYKVRKLYRRLPGFIRQGMIKKFVDCLPVSHKKLSFDFKAKRFVRGAELDDATSHFYWRVVLSDDLKELVVSHPERFKGFLPSAQLFVDKYNQCGADDELNRLLYIDFSYHLPDDLMIKNDRMTMAHSLEARVPFTDLDLVNFLASVPVNLKLKGMRTKHLLRASMAGTLPKEVLRKKKVGLEMPYSRWLLFELRDLAESMLTVAKLNATGLFNAQGVRRIWESHLRGEVDHGRPLWGLLNYMIWHDMYIEKGDYSNYLSSPRPPRTAKAYTAAVRSPSTSR